jgi:hypothetical protein
MILMVRLGWKVMYVTILEDGTWLTTPCREERGKTGDKWFREERPHLFLIVY